MILSTPPKILGFCFIRKNFLYLLSQIDMEVVVVALKQGLWAPKGSKKELFLAPIGIASKPVFIFYGFINTHTHTHTLTHISLCL